LINIFAFLELKVNLTSVIDERMLGGKTKKNIGNIRTYCSVLNYSYISSFG